MPDQTKCATDGCPGDPSVPGSAKGCCPRCYQWTRRHPNGPPPPVKRGDDLTETLSVRVSPATKKAANKKAKAAGAVGVTTWVAGLIAKAIAE